MFAAHYCLAGQRKQQERPLKMCFTSDCYRADSTARLRIGASGPRANCKLQKPHVAAWGWNMFSIFCWSWLACNSLLRASEDGPLASWSRCHGRFGFSICLHRRFFDSKHVTTVFLHMQMFFHEGLIKTYQKTPSWCLRVLYFASYVRGSSGDSVSAYGCL